MSNYGYRQSKLTKAQERQAYLRIFLIGFLSLVLVIFLFTWGIQVLVSIADLWGVVRGTNQNTTSTTSNKTIAPFAPRLEPLGMATNSAKLTVRGFAKESTIVELFLNDQTAGQTKVSDDKTFQFDNLTLIEGQNSLVAFSADEAGNKSQPSERLLIAYQTKAPKLDVNTPSDRQVFSGDQKTALVSGKIEQASTVTVNGFWAILNSDGTFSYNLSLNSGDNSMHVEALDEAGNKTTKDLTVIYNP